MKITEDDLKEYQRMWLDYLGIPEGLPDTDKSKIHAFKIRMSEKYSFNTDQYSIDVYSGRIAKVKKIF